MLPAPSKGEKEERERRKEKCRRAEKKREMGVKEGGRRRRKRNQCVDGSEVYTVSRRPCVTCHILCCVVLKMITTSKVHASLGGMEV